MAMIDLTNWHASISGGWGQGPMLATVVGHLANDWVLVVKPDGDHEAVRVGDVTFWRPEDRALAEAHVEANQPSSDNDEEEDDAADQCTETGAA